MKYDISLLIAVAAFVVAFSIPTTATFSRAASGTPGDNLEKLKKTNSCRGCDLSGLTLKRMNFAGADLEGADLSRTKFQLSSLSGANLRNANLRGASFGGCDLGEADLRGADLRGTSLEGAYLDKTLLEGEFITAKPYEEVGVDDVEKQVYVPSPEKPKKIPEPGEVKVAPRKEVEESQRALARETAPSEKVAGAAAQKVVAAPPELQPGAPVAKKAVALRRAIVEPEDSQTKAKPVAQETSGAVDDIGNGSLGNNPTSPGLWPKMPETAKPSPVPPKEVKMDDVRAAVGGSETPAAEFEMEITREKD